MNFRDVRLELQRLAEAGDRFVQSSLSQRHAKLMVRGLGIGLERQGAAETILGFVELAPVCQAHAQPVQGRQMLGLKAQRGTEAGLGFDRLSVPGQRQAAVEMGVGEIGVAAQARSQQARASVKSPC